MVWCKVESMLHQRFWMTWIRGVMPRIPNSTPQTVWLHVFSFPPSFLFFTTKTQKMCTFSTITVLALWRQLRRSVGDADMSRVLSPHWGTIWKFLMSNMLSPSFIFTSSWITAWSDFILQSHTVLDPFQPQSICGCTAWEVSFRAEQFYTPCYIFQP